MTLDDLVWHEINNTVWTSHVHLVGGIISVYRHDNAPADSAYSVYGPGWDNQWIRVSKLTAQCALNHLLEGYNKVT